MPPSVSALVAADVRLAARRIKGCPTVAEGFAVLDEFAKEGGGDHNSKVVPHELVAAELLNLCARHGDPAGALRVVERVPTSDICRARAISILGGHHGRARDVWHVLWQQPAKDGVYGSAAPYNSAIAAFGRLQQWDQALLVLNDTMPPHLVTSVTVNAALTVCRRAKRPKECLSTLQRHPAHLDRTSYHTALSCLLENGHMTREACRLIRTMEAKASVKLQPNADTYARLSAALTKRPDLHWPIVRELLAEKIGREITAPAVDFQDWTLKKHQTGKRSFWELGTLVAPSTTRAADGHRLAGHDAGDNGLLVGLQPNRNPAVNGMKLVFHRRDAAGKPTTKLGYLLMINSHKKRSSQFLGQFVDQTYRGQGLAKVFFAIWLRICLDAGLKPCTGKIRKPLLCLVLQQTFGMIPQAGGIDAVLSPGKDANQVVLWSPSGQSLEGAMSPLDLRQQNVRLSVEPPNPPGRAIVLNCDFVAPPKAALETAVTSILANRFKLHGSARKDDLGLILLGA